MTHNVVGVDIGGTKTSASLIAEDGTVSFQRQSSTPASVGPKAILDNVAAIVRQVADAAGSRLDACGVGSAGTFDSHGAVSYATNHLAGWAGTHVAEELEARLGIPVLAINDVHAAAFGELWFGSGRNRSRMVFVAIGTGIGGASVAGGRILRGDSGLAGAIGHLPVKASVSRICSCGGTDHVEAFASGPALERTYRELTSSQLDLRTIGELAWGGDTIALSVLRSGARYLAQALTGVITLVDPGMVVLGGGVMALGDLLLQPTVEYLAATLPGPLARTPVGAASLNNEACAIGAGALALRRLSDPNWEALFV